MTVPIQRLGPAMALVLLLGWALSGGAQLVATDDSQGLSLFEGNVSASSFNPSVEDTAGLTYQHSHSAEVTLNVFDSDQKLTLIWESNA